MQEAFGRNVYGFLERTFNKEQFDRVMDSVFNIKEGILELDNKGMKYLKTESILYIKAEGNYTLVVTETEKFIERKSMAEWEKILGGEEFFRIHKSYIVNLYQVAYNPSGKYVLKNGEKIPISRYKLNEFKNCYNNFLKRKVGD